MSDEIPTPIVRVTIDLHVREGDPEKVAKAIFKRGKEVANYITGVVIATDATVGEGKVESVARGTHVHDTAIGYCAMCDRYARKPILVAFTED